jgi:hypothetical protein
VLHHATGPRGRVAPPDNVSATVDAVTHAAAAFSKRSEILDYRVERVVGAGPPGYVAPTDDTREVGIVADAERTAVRAAKGAQVGDVAGPGFAALTECCGMTCATTQETAMTRRFLSLTGLAAVRRRLSKRSETRFG